MGNNHSANINNCINILNKLTEIKDLDLGNEIWRDLRNLSFSYNEKKQVKNILDSFIKGNKALINDMSSPVRMFLLFVTNTLRSSRTQRIHDDMNLNFLLYFTKRLMKNICKKHSYIKLIGLIEFSVYYRQFDLIKKQETSGMFLVYRDKYMKVQDVESIDEFKDEVLNWIKINNPDEYKLFLKYNFCFSDESNEVLDLHSFYKLLTLGKWKQKGEVYVYFILPLMININVDSSENFEKDNITITINNDKDKDYNKDKDNNSKDNNSNDINIDINNQRKNIQSISVSKYEIKKNFIKHPTNSILCNFIIELILYCLYCLKEIAETYESLLIFLQIQSSIFSIFFYLISINMDSFTDKNIYVERSGSIEQIFSSNNTSSKQKTKESIDVSSIYNKDLVNEKEKEKEEQEEENEKKKKNIANNLKWTNIKSMIYAPSIFFFLKFY